MIVVSVLAVLRFAFYRFAVLQLYRSAALPFFRFDRFEGFRFTVLELRPFTKRFCALPRRCFMTCVPNTALCIVRCVAAKRIAHLSSECILVQHMIAYKPSLQVCSNSCIHEIR